MKWRLELLIFKVISHKQQNHESLFKLNAVCVLVKAFDLHVVVSHKQGLAGSKYKTQVTGLCFTNTESILNTRRS